MVCMTRLKFEHQEVKGQQYQRNYSDSDIADPLPVTIILYYNRTHLIVEGYK